MPGASSVQPRGTNFCGKDPGAVGEQPIDGRSPDLRASVVTFPPGTRTRCHRHDKCQILHATAGEGWVQIGRAAPVPLRAGQTVFIPGGVPHWHGATRSNPLEHIAVTLGETAWDRECPPLPADPGE